ncbi:hypothetical protein MKX03_008411, partial [Papaver bracteatum]
KELEGDDPEQDSDQELVSKSDPEPGKESDEESEKDSGKEPEEDLLFAYSICLKYQMMRLFQLM